MPTLSESKQCCHCKNEKSLSSFNNDKSRPDGKALTCKECRSSQRKKLRAIDPQKYDEPAKRWKRENKEYYAKLAFINRHGISKDDVLQTVQIQNGCAICGIKEPLGDGRWHVDHDHSCCKNGSCDSCRRGVLCNFCNSMIGFARENKEILLSAIDYLEKYRKENNAYIG